MAAFGATLLLLVAAAGALADGSGGPKPSIESESASHITASDATLEALVNPGTGEDGFALATTYEFFLESPWCGFRVPFGACEASGGVLVYKGTTPGGATAPQLESVDLASVGQQLSPNTTYGYRVVARNDVGEAFGAEKTFTTLSGNSPCVEDPQDCSHPSSVTPGPVSNEPEVPLADGGQPASGGSSLQAPTGSSAPAVDASSKSASGTPSTKHGKRHRHAYHGTKPKKHKKHSKHRG